ncbi:MAG: cysteine hydrolase family protein [Candidatus Nanopelagicales bacterium]
MPTDPRHALVVIDVQQGFDDPAWGRRDNPGAEANIAALVSAWRSSGQPIVIVRHDSVSEGSPLRPGQSGNDLRPGIDGDVLVTKHVNSAFYGEPDLHAWLTERGIGKLTICGVTTNHCCETTARMAGNLGYDVDFVIDATHTFDRPAPDGGVITAEEISRVTAANLQGEFATVRTTRDVLDAD